MAIRSDQEPYVVVGEMLAPGTAAQIIRAYGETEVQVNEAIPDHLWLVVARHAVDRHRNGCYTRHCIAARGWLRSPPRRLTIVSVSA